VLPTKREPGSSRNHHNRNADIEHQQARSTFLSGRSRRCRELRDLCRWLSSGRNRRGNSRRTAVTVGGNAVAVAEGSGVAVGGIAVAVGGIGVSVGGSGVAVGGTRLLGGTDVAVTGSVGLGVAVGAFSTIKQASSQNDRCV
jgi:hypothetical protein